MEHSEKTKKMTVQTLKPRERHPQLLAGMTVLIVGGRDKLSKFYVDEIYKLGAKSVEHRNPDRVARLEGLCQDLIIFLVRRTGHNAGDKIQKLPGKLVRVVKYQRTTFLRAVISALRKD